MGGYADFEHLTPTAPRSTGKSVLMSQRQVVAKIILACTDCQQRNYDTTKEKKNHPDRMET